jgi:MFS family permease
VGAVNRGASDNPLGLGLVIVGAAVIVIAAFLPLVEPPGGFRRVEENTPIEHSGGWMLIALAFGIAASGYRVSRGRRREGWVPIVLCVMAAVLIVLNSSDKDLRTLYPVGPDGNPITTQPGKVANLGIAIYVAGAGVAAAFIGSVMLLRSAKHELDASDDDLVGWRAAQRRQAKTKKCPVCTETVLADAEVCKRCGYRFASSASSDN